MKIERYVLEVAMPDDLQGQISAHQILKTIRQNVNHDDLLNGLSFDLTTPENILWIQNNQIKGSCQGTLQSGISFICNLHLKSINFQIIFL